MICGFCNKEIPDQLPEISCGRCGSGCRKVHCPHCGYENPAPSEFLNRLFKKKDKTSKEGKS
jgi:hypothetical protein